MRKLLVPFGQKNPIADLLAKKLFCSSCEITIDNFPEEEKYVKILADSKDNDIILLSTLNNPNETLLPLILLGETLKDWKAKSVGLVCPYLPFMENNKTLDRLSGCTVRKLAKQISDNFDWIVTVDPYLHNHDGLEEIYPIPSQIVYSAPAITDWITINVKNPLLVRWSNENNLWIDDVARKEKLSCIEVVETSYEVSVPDKKKWKNHTPIIVAEAISDEREIINIIKILKSSGMNSPICICIHGVFSNSAYKLLCGAGVESVVTSNTIPHVSNKIDISDLLSDAINKIMN